MRIILCLGVALLAPPAVFAFGGEDIVDGSPWHHADITRRATTNAAIGFSPAAADSIAWNADYIDSYLYNPVFWFSAENPYDRTQAALAIRDDLIELHFDDLFSTAALEAAWQRYLTGTLAGLLWAAEKHGAQEAIAIPIAHNVLGVSLHAVQDFYSHTTWIDDPEFRPYTFFEVAPDQLLGATVSSGAYELGEHLGEHSHGVYAPSCTVLNNSVVPEVLDVACQAISPLSNSGVCQQFKACQQGASVGIAARGIELPENVAYLAPPGIALDNTWMARIAASERALVEDTELVDDRGFLSCQEDCQAVIWPDGAVRTCRASDFAFATAKQRALEASIQWLGLIRDALVQAGYEEFWRAIGEADVAEPDRTSIYEDLVHAPFQFLSAGDYPLDGSEEANPYYLRLRLRTGDMPGAGTNGDIVLTTDDELPDDLAPTEMGYPTAGSSLLGDRSDKPAFLLDYIPYDLALLNVNDFERADDRVYTVGPFSELPASVTLHNTGGSIVDVAETMGQSVIDAVDGALTTARRTVIGLIGGNADAIGQGHYVFRTEELTAVRPGRGIDRTIRVHDDFGEGTYDVTVNLYKFSNSPIEEGKHRFQARITHLEVVQEGDFDRGSDSDEPFVLAVLNPLPGDLQSQILGPFDDADSGERIEVPAGRGDFQVFEVDARRGMISFAVMLMESDDENESDREQALRAFANDIDEDLEDAERGVLDAISAGIASDWLLEHVEVTAFRHGERACARTVLQMRADTWLERGAHFRVDLPAADPCRDVQVAYADLRQVEPCRKASVRTGEELARCLEQGGVIELRAGSYVLPGPVVVSRDVEIVGEGVASTTIRSSARGSLIRFEGCGHFRAEQVTFVAHTDLSPAVLEFRDGTSRLSFCAVRGARSVRGADAGDELVDASGVVALGRNTRLIVEDSEIVGHSLHGLAVLEEAAVDLVATRIAQNGSAGTAVFDQARVTFEGGVVFANDGHGVAAAYGSPQVALRGTVVRDNRGSGLALFDSSVGTLLGGESNSNGQHGVAVDHDARVTVRGSRMEGNGESGLHVRWGNGTVVEDTTIREHPNPGVVLDGASGVEMRRNLIQENDQDGLMILRGLDGVFEENTITGNGGYAYYVGWSGLEIDFGGRLTPNGLGITNE